MTSGNDRPESRSRRATLVALLTLAAAVAIPPYRDAIAQTAGSAAPPASSGGWSLDQLLNEIGQRKKLRARFVERQFLALLDEPVDASGELRFEAPGRLEKRTLKPRTEVLAIDGDQVRVERPGLNRTMSLQQLPEIAPLIESLRATLNGDRKALESVFDASLSGRREDWKLTLRPRERRGVTPLARVIVLSGAQAEVRQVEIEQNDGDRSLMRILDTQ